MSFAAAHRAGALSRLSSLYGVAEIIVVYDDGKARWQPDSGGLYTRVVEES